MENIHIICFIFIVQLHGEISSVNEPDIKDLKIRLLQEQINHIIAWFCGRSLPMAALTMSMSLVGQRYSYKLWDKPSAPAKPTLTPNPEGSDPDIITIQWEPPLSDGGSKLTGYIVEHRRTGSPHWVKATPIKVIQKHLTLSGLEPGWRYQFRVFAENAFGISEPSPLSEPLAISVHKMAAIAPYFLIGLHDTTALENEKVEFIVKFQGIPTPKITWYKDGFKTYSNRCLKITTNDDSSSMIIHETSVTDDGEIKCSATNRAGHAITKANLKVKAPPKIRLPRQYEDGLLFEKGETIRLKVSVAGQPNPSVNWFHNGELLLINKRCDITYADQISTLKIKDAQRYDRGEYQIHAMNAIGEEFASIMVTIAYKPEVPSRVCIDKILGRSVTLSWTNPDDDGGCKIGYFIVEYYKIGWNVWLKAATCRQLTVTLENLIEGARYKFRVKAENPYGISDAGPESEVIIIPDQNKWLDNVDENWLENETVYKEEQSLMQETDNLDFIRNSPFNTSKERIEKNILSHQKLQVPEKPKRKHYRKHFNADIRRKSDKNTPDENDSAHSLCPSPQLSNNSRANSELMLLLLPDSQLDTELKNVSRKYSTGIDLFNNVTSIPPPMSLSAPELGTSNFSFQPIQRNCVSSSEFLQECATARVYNDMLHEEESDKSSIREYSYSNYDKSVLPKSDSIKYKLVEDTNLHLKNTDNLSCSKMKYRNQDDKFEVKTNPHCIKFSNYVRMPERCETKLDSNKYEDTKRDDLSILGRGDCTHYLSYNKPCLPQFYISSFESEDYNSDEQSNYIDNSALEDIKQDILHSEYRSKSSSPLNFNTITRNVDFSDKGSESENLYASSNDESDENLFSKYKTSSMSDVVQEMSIKNPDDISSLPNTTVQHSSLKKHVTCFQLNNYNPYSGILGNQKRSSPVAEMSAHKNPNQTENYLATNKETSTKVSEFDSISHQKPTHIEFDITEDSDKFSTTLPNCIPMQMKKDEFDIWESDHSYEECDDDLNECNDHDDYMTDIRECDEMCPLSFERAVEISNSGRFHKRISPTKDTFLEDFDDLPERGNFDKDVIIPFYLNSDNHTNLSAEQATRLQPCEKLERVNDNDNMPYNIISNNSKIVLKPILKSQKHSNENGASSSRLNEQPNFLSGFMRQTGNFLKNNPKQLLIKTQKKQVRIAEPNDHEMEKNIPKEYDPSLIVINHYSDIVKEFGMIQKPSTKVYLTYDELKAAANLCEHESEINEHRSFDSHSMNGNFNERSQEDFINFNSHLDENSGMVDISSNLADNKIINSQFSNDSNMQKVRNKVHFLFDFSVDLVMFVLACWFYFFKDVRLAIPIIMLMIYRQIYEKLKKKVISFKSWLWNRNTS